MEEKRPIIVSIKCITYNHASFIRQCLDGFVKQKTNFRFEAIVHDDASTDGTADIILEYAEKYPDIIKPIFETENQYSKGNGALTKIMYEACKGKYVALCEGDDYWTDPLKLQKQVDFMESDTEEKYVMCFHDSTIIDDRGRVLDPNLFSKENMRDLSAMDLMMLNMPPTQTVMYRNYIYIKELPNIVKSCHIVTQDAILSFMLGKYGCAKYLSEVGNSVYRIHSGGVWSCKKQIEKDQMLYALYSFLRNQSEKTYTYYTQRQRTFSAKIAINALKERQIKIFLKYYFISNWLFLKTKDFKGIWNIQKGVVYNIIHK